MNLLDEKVHQIHTEATSLIGAGITATASIHRAQISVISKLSTEEIDTILSNLDERKCIRIPGNVKSSDYYNFEDGIATLAETLLGLKRHLIHSSIRSLIGSL